MEKLDVNKQFIDIKYDVQSSEPGAERCECMFRIVAANNLNDY